jgi:hypothetical protein
MDCREFPVFRWQGIRVPALGTFPPGQGTNASSSLRRYSQGRLIIVDALYQFGTAFPRPSSLMASDGRPPFSDGDLFPLKT